MRPEVGRGKPELSATEGGHAGATGDAGGDFQPNCAKPEWPAVCVVDAELARSGVIWSIVMTWTAAQPRRSQGPRRWTASVAIRRTLPSPYRCRD